MITQRDFKLIGKNLNRYYPQREAVNEFESGFTIGWDLAIKILCDSFTELNHKFKKDLFMADVEKLK